MWDRVLVAAGACALTLLLAECSDSEPGAAPSSGTIQSPEPSPTPTEFEQTSLTEVTGGSTSIKASAEKTEHSLRADSLGLSFEATDLADPRLDPDASNLDELLNALGSPALRFGGNALDRRNFWTSEKERPKHSAKSTIGPDDLRRLKKLVDVTGSTVTLGIPLGAYDPARGADMAAHAVDILGNSLVGLAIGNELHGYIVDDVPDGAVRGDGWNNEEYVQQLEAYAKAIHGPPAGGSNHWTRCL